MDDNFSARVKDVISFSKEEALRLGHDYIGTEHLMLGILRDGGGKAITILNNIDIDLENLSKKVEILNPKFIKIGNKIKVSDFLLPGNKEIIFLSSGIKLSIIVFVFSFVSIKG